METVTVKVDALKYKTADGTIFDNVKDAGEWEQNVKCVSFSRIKDKLKEVENDDVWDLSYMCGFTCADVRVRTFIPETEDDIRNFFIYVNARDYNLLSYCKDMEQKMRTNEKYLIVEGIEYEDMAIFSRKSFREFIDKREQLFEDLMKD